MKRELFYDLALIPQSCQIKINNITTDARKADPFHLRFPPIASYLSAWMLNIAVNNNS